MLQAALAAQAAGLHIFPVAVGQKVPHRLAGEWGATATNDFNRIVDFWTRLDPNANIGVACKPSQLLVVDLDIAKADANLRGTEWEYMHTVYGARVNGTDLIDEMAYKLAEEDADDYLDTLTVRTGSGGTHLYYWWPDGWPRISQASPVKGLIDVRGNGGTWGGYVLGAGSRTVAGSYEVSSKLAINKPPMWIRQLVAEKPKIQRAATLTGIRQPGAISWSGLVETVRNAGEGNRNNSLLWCARTMCEEGADVAEALRTLGPPAEQAGLDAIEIERTVQSAFRTQQQKV
jgi:hypothetical protein